MEKLSKINEELLGKNNLKKIFKKGMQIGVLGAALAAGTIMGTSCSQPTNDSDYTYDDNYSQPYDKTLGNGFVIHSFIGKNTTFPKDTVVEDVNYYLGKGETYVKGLVDKFDQSLEGRPDAQNYFSNYINALKNNNLYYVDANKPGDTTIDRAIIANSSNSEYIFADIIKNLDTPTERGQFYHSYHALANEAYKEGLGNYSSGPLMDVYQDTKDNINLFWDEVNDFDLNNDLNNNCSQITSLLNTLINQAAGKMNLNAADLRQVINLTMTTDSMRAMHNRSQNNLEHNNCVLRITLYQAMETAANEAKQVQNQDVELER